MKNDEIDRLFAYHDRTKHSPVSVRGDAHWLDWENQPNPFRVYEGVPRILLERAPPLPELGTRAALAQLAQRAQSVAPPLTGSSRMPFAGARLDRAQLSTLLWHSLAISRWKQVRGTDFRYSLRVNPSSGNLHPTECHLAVPPLPDLEAGLYHYRALDHALEQRGSGDAVGALLATTGRAARADADDTEAVLAFTSIFWRESWKYRNRAYRYCLLDLGHALFSVLAAAAALGLQGEALGWFEDVALTEALGQVAGALESEEEPLLLVRLFRPLGPDATTDAETPAATAATAKRPRGPFLLSGGRPNRLSEEEVPYLLLQGMHESTELAAPLPAPPSVAPHPLVPADVLPATPTRFTLELLAAEQAEALAGTSTVGDLPLGVVVRRRRSAVDHDPERSKATLAQFRAILSVTLVDFRADFRGNTQSQGDADGGSPAGRRFVTPYLYVHRVEGIDPGTYRLTREQGLELLKPGDVRATAARLSLEQALAGNATFAVSLIAEMEEAARLFGCRAYRVVHTEAGAIGQALYLAAESVGLQATGIGAFYDDEVHRYLGLTGRARQVVYHFAVGGAQPDDRLLDVDGPSEVSS